MGNRRRRGYNRSRGGTSPWATVAIAISVIVAVVGLGLLGVVAGLKWQKRPLPKHLIVIPTLPVVETPPEPEKPALPDILLNAASDVVPIIMYHDVVPRKQVWFDLTTDEFAQQMHDLAEAGAHPISMQDLYDHYKTNKSLPEHPIVLTFDDCTLGHFTEALPILKSRKFPAVFFVQTASVGVRTEKEHMTWDQLKEAEATGLITVESHTVTHPEDITKCTDTALQTEMQDSKHTLEEHLGHTVNFLAYPSGNCDARVEKAAQDAGYVAAVTMDRGWVAGPAQSFFLPRFTPKRVDEVIAHWKDDGPIGPPLPRLIEVKNTPLEMGTYKDGKFPVQWVAGGDLGSQAIQGRKTVGEIAHDANVQAALNGTFFADARVDSIGSAMIGPTFCRVDKAYNPADASEDSRLEGRPLILVGESKCLILPYAAHLGHSLEVLQSVMPDVKDAFLAGGWIVHQGKALAPELIKTWSTSDANDPRHRAFVGIDSQSRYILGATQDSVSTSDLAKILEQMHLEEAWLMDSGFSTSLIWQNHVLVSGHFHKDRPSRPVPHALLLFGDTAPDATPPPPDTPIAFGPGAATTAEALALDGGAPHPSSHHRRRRHPKS
jgi:poly-beta-1,6-N-acetyl-D-glucosamine N-deacetylase